MPKPQKDTNRKSTRWEKMEIFVLKATLLSLEKPTP